MRPKSSFTYMFISQLLQEVHTFTSFHHRLSSGVAPWSTISFQIFQASFRPVWRAFRLPRKLK